MNIKKFISSLIFAVIILVGILLIFLINPKMPNTKSNNTVTVLGKSSVALQSSYMSVKVANNRIIKEILYKDENTKPTIMVNEYHDIKQQGVLLMSYNFESIIFKDNNGAKCETLNVYCNTLDEAIEQANNLFGRGNIKVVSGSLKDYAEFTTLDNLQVKKRKYNTNSLEGQRVTCIEYFVKTNNGVSIVKCYANETATEEYYDNMVINSIKY